MNHSTSASAGQKHVLIHFVSRRTEVRQQHTCIAAVKWNELNVGFTVRQRRSRLPNLPLPLIVAFRRAARRFWMAERKQTLNFTFWKFLIKAGELYKKRPNLHGFH